MYYKISETVKKREYLQSAVEKLKCEIKNTVPNDLFLDVVKINDKRKYRENFKSRMKQRDKYYKLKYGKGYNEYHTARNL